MRIDEPLAIEGADVAFGRFAGVAEYQFEMRIGGDRRRGARTDGTDVDAFVNSFEEPRERGAAMFHAAIIQVGFWDLGFGIWTCREPAHGLLRSLRAR